MTNGSKLRVSSRKALLLAGSAFCLLSGYFQAYASTGLRYASGTVTVDGPQPISMQWNSPLPTANYVALCMSRVSAPDFAANALNSQGFPVTVSTKSTTAIGVEVETIGSIPPTIVTVSCIALGADYSGSLRYGSTTLSDPDGNGGSATLSWNMPFQDNSYTAVCTEELERTDANLQVDSYIATFGQTIDSLSITESADSTAPQIGQVPGTVAIDCIGLASNDTTSARGGSGGLPGGDQAATEDVSWTGGAIAGTYITECGIMSADPSLQATASLETSSPTGVTLGVVNVLSGSGSVTCLAFTPQSYTIVDPYPSLLTSDNAKRITIDYQPDDVLTKGRMVAGVAADGISRVLIALLTTSSDAVQFTDSGDGCLFNPSVSSPGTCAPSPVSIQPAKTKDGQSYYAIVGYIAPIDFETATNTADLTQTRQVTITANDSNKTSMSVQIVRPPLVLVHGVWSNGSTWSHVIQQLSPFSYYVANYSGTSGSSVAVNDPIVFGEITTFLSGFRSNNRVAAAQVDVVAHSMGGLVTRQIQANPANQRQSNYMQGPIHKLITIGTPYGGSPFADALIKETTASSEDPLCPLGNLFSLAGLTIGGAVHDLSPANVQKVTSDLPMHAIVGIADLDITNATEGSFAFIALTHACPSFINSNGSKFNTFFGGPNDLIVPAASQQSGYSSDPNATEKIASSVSHAVIPHLLPFGPGELGDPGAPPAASPEADEATEAKYLANRIKVLMNTPVTDSGFFLHDQ